MSNERQKIPRSVLTISSDKKSAHAEGDGHHKVPYSPSWRKIPSLGSFGDYNTSEYFQYNQESSNDLHALYGKPEEVWTPGTAVVTPHGTMSLRLKNKIKIDMTLDRSIRVINKANNVVLALDTYGSSSAFLHPHGRIYQHGSKVEIYIHDPNGVDKMAKMWYKGVSFSSVQNALVYLVDAGGARTTTDTFQDLSTDFSLPIFYDNSRHGPNVVKEAVSTLQNASYWINSKNTEHWKIKDLIITQSTDDVINIYRDNMKYQMNTRNSLSAMMSTPFIHCSASKDHMFIRRGDRRMHFDGSNFIVRNAGHSAGFNEFNDLKVF